MADRRLFGTDGVRGVAGEFLSAQLALSLARAATAITAEVASGHPQVLVIRDTRISGDMLEAAVCAGITEAGADALIGGVLPTPAAPLIVDRYGLDLAVVISASHNAYSDNGIKFFGADGMKLSGQVEAQIESRVGDPAPPVATIGRVRRLTGAEDDYLRALTDRFNLDLSGMRIALDCANGATYRVAPRLFERLGAEVDAIGIEPNGININSGVGSTHVDLLANHAALNGTDLGFAFDGDGDRVIAVDCEGHIVDGDEILALLALHLRERGELKGSGVAVTVMSNYGFHRAMEAAEIELAVTGVGDRYVLEALRKRQWQLGGEQSGHVINLGFNSTGDGLAAALLVIEALKARGEELRSGALVEKLPQRLESVPVADRDRISSADDLWRVIEREQQQLEGRGRVLVRSSGTEPLVRVMVEAPTNKECDRVCDRITAAVRAIEETLRHTG